MIRAPWFLPPALLVGTLCSHAAFHRFHRAQRDRRYLDWWVLLVVGWIPILAWILSQWVGQD